MNHNNLRDRMLNTDMFSNIKKRQEIGRGMRIPINQLGERIIPAEYNVLTVIANENYKEYISKLQQEYVDEYGSDVALPKIANARNRTTLKLKRPRTFLILMNYGNNFQNEQNTKSISIAEYLKINV